MTTTVRELAVRVTGDSSVYIREISRAKNKGHDFYAAMEQRAKRFDAYIANNKRSIESINHQLTTLGATFTTVFASIVGLLTIPHLIKVADDAGQMSIRVKQALETATGSAEKFEEVQARLVEMSNRNSRALNQTQLLYIQTASSMNQLHLTTEQTIAAISTLNNEFTINASDAQKTEGAINALSKALLRGKISSVELTSIMSAMPLLFTHIADNMNIQEAELKKAVLSNKISLRELLIELTKIEDKTEEMAKEMPNTFADAGQQIINALTTYSNTVNDSNHITGTLTSGLIYLAHNFDMVADSAIVLVGVGLARYFGNLTQSIYSSIAASIEKQRTDRATLLSEKARISSKLELIATQKAQLELQKQNIIMGQFYSNSLKTQISLDKQLAKVEKELTAVRKIESAETLRLAAANKSLNLVSKAGSSLLGLMGGPVGLIATVGILAATFIDFSNSADQTKESLIDMAKPLKDLIEQYNKLDEAQKKAARNQTKDDYASNLSDYNNKISEIARRMESALSDYQITPFGEGVVVVTKEQRQLLKTWTEEVQTLTESVKNNAITQKDFATEIAKVNDKALKGIDINDTTRKTIENLSADLSPLVGQLIKGSQVIDYINQGSDNFGNKLKDSINFTNIENQYGSLSQQLAIVKIRTEEGAEAADILSGLQRAAGEEALLHADALYKMAKEQKIVGEYTDITREKLEQYLELIKKQREINENIKRDENYKNALNALKSQISATKQLSEYEKTHNAIISGKYGKLLPFQIVELENTSKQLDLIKKTAEEEKKAEIERNKNQENYNKLVLSLRTPEQQSLQEMQEKAELVAKMAKSEEERIEIMEKITKQSIVDPPKTNINYNGLGSEILRIFEDEKALDDWYQEQLDKQKDFLAKKWINEDTYYKNITNLTMQYEKEQSDILDAYKIATLGVFSSMTGSIADMFRETAGESSAAYKTMFLASRSAAIAQATISTLVAANKAREIGEPYGETAASIVMGLGMANVGLIAAQTIAGMAHSGIDYIPREGTWLLDKGERVLDARTNADLKNFLKNPNGFTVNVPPALDARTNANLISRLNNTNGLTINVPVSIVNSEYTEGEAKALGNVIRETVLSVIDNEKRAGGKLAHY